MDLKILKSIREKQDVLVVSVVILISISALIVPNVGELVESDTLKYLGSALIQSFAALIAIPFAFYSSYLHSKYGRSGLQFAIDRVKEYILPLFTLMGIASVALILFPNYPDIPMIEFSYEFILKTGLFVEFLVSGLLLYVIYKHLIEVMSVTPSKLAKWIVEKKLGDKNSYKSFQEIFEEFKGMSELLVISLKDATLIYDSRDVLIRFLKLLKKYPMNETTDFSKDILRLSQTLEVIDTVVNNMEHTNSASAIPPEIIEDLVQTLSEIYADFLVRHHQELSNDINLDTRIIESVYRMHKMYYGMITKLSIMYSRNFYKLNYRTFEKYLPSQARIFLESISVSIKEMLRYLKHSQKLDSESAIFGTPKTLAAVSDIDFIFDGLLLKLENEDLELLLANSREDLEELIMEIKYLLLPATPERSKIIPVSPVISGKRVYIEDRDTIFKVLVAWTRGILYITEKIVQNTPNKQDKDKNGPSEELSNRYAAVEQDTLQSPITEVVKEIKTYSKRLSETIKQLSPLLENSRSSQEQLKNSTALEWSLKELLIKNIVELYAVFDCKLIFKPDSEIVTLESKKLIDTKRWFNIGLPSEKFTEIHDYLKNTALQQFIE